MKFSSTGTELLRKSLPTDKAAVDFGLGGLEGFKVEKLWKSIFDKCTTIIVGRYLEGYRYQGNCTLTKNFIFVRGDHSIGRPQLDSFSARPDLPDNPAPSQCDDNDNDSTTLT